MFKSILSARKEIVRLLLGLPSLQSAGSIDGFESATNEKETTELVTAREVDETRAPISPFRVAIANGAGPEILKNWLPEPDDSTPDIPGEKETPVAFENPQIRSVSTLLT